jgi:NAD(P)-dependent dehydrogenase (short-subunit alcohol dehydrogenase family)
MKLQDRTAVVTGAGQGIGKAIALKLAAEGANIAVVDINEVNVHQTVEEIKSLGQKSIGYVKDLSIIQDIGQLYKQISEDFNQINIAVNGAGVIRIKPMLENSEDDWDFIMDINAKSTFFTMLEAAKAMKKNGGGKIVNIASTGGKQTNPDQSIYGVSKAAVLSFTKTGAIEFAPDNINVNAICPGFVHTKMWDQIDAERAELYGQQKGAAINAILKRIPKGRSAELDDIANLVSFLVSDEADYINGQSINICGGLVMY